MAQAVWCLPGRSRDPGVIPRTHIKVEGKTAQHCFLSSTCTVCHEQPQICITHTQENVQIIENQLSLFFVYSGSWGAIQMILPSEQGAEQLRMS